MRVARLVAISAATAVTAAPAQRAATPTTVSSVSLDGRTYINKGIVGFGIIPSDFKESTGDTLGGIGSAIALEPGSFKQINATTYSGRLLVHPDRGYNVETTIDYQARLHTLEFVLTPYYDSKKLSWENAQKTFAVKYVKTQLEVDEKGQATTGLDGLGIRPAVVANSQGTGGFPQLPAASGTDLRLSLDIEGLVVNPDGSYWLSDEYGPAIYLFSKTGKLLRAITPPSAVLPLDGAGKLNFTSVTNPVTGRQGNQGFEGLTIDPSTQTLYALLQSATLQDGGAAKETSRYTRLLAYNITQDPAKLTGEWIVPLPQSKKLKTRASSEILYVGQGVFISLSRDGDGRGGDSTESGYKQADLFSITSATDIHGTKFDDPANAVAPNGVLDPSITPAKYVSFVDYLDEDQLDRFGLHNGGDDDRTLIDSKWESFALAKVNDPAYPDDYFLFTVADNDYISEHGISLGKPFDAGLDVDNQFLVWRVTLPGAAKGVGKW